MQTAAGAKGRDSGQTPFPSGIKFLNTIKETAEATNRSPSSVYLMLAAGELEAVKDGARTLVTGESIMRRTASLPRFRSREAA